MAPCFTNIGGVQREKSSLICGIGGAQRELASAVAGIGGVQREIFGGKGIALADLSEGSIVYLNENGSPVEFYVAKHNYESGLNGAGRTLLVRKNVYDYRAWCAKNGTGFWASNPNTYATSDLDAWFNGDYARLLDANTLDAIGTTKFYYTVGEGNYNVTTLERAIFSLSMTELGWSGDYTNVEGSALPIAETLITVYMDDGSGPVTQWTRSPRLNNDGYACDSYFNQTRHYNVVSTEYGSRPCFTLPSTAVFDPETMRFVSAT